MQPNATRNPDAQSLRVMFVAGDPSGDIHAARILSRLHQRPGGCEAFGIGGPALKREGLRELLPFDKFSHMGFLEVFVRLPFFLSAKSYLVRRMKEEGPSVVVLVDYPGFNIPVMKAARRLGIPVVWYIAPKAWAWKRKRAAVLAAHATRVAAIFPFEVDFFGSFGAAVEFVGNPLVEQLPPPERHKTEGGAPRLALVPGSRRQEIDRILGPMIEACRILRRTHPGLDILVSRCSWLPNTLYSKHIGDMNVGFHDGALGELLSSSDVAMVTSGTATLEAALLGIPHIVVYRTSFVTYAIFRLVLTIPHISLPNIVAGREIVPEYIQGEARPRALATQIERYLSSAQAREAMRKQLLSLRARLGGKSPSHEVPRIIYEVSSGSGT